MLNQHQPEKPIFQTSPFGNKVLKTTIKPHTTTCSLAFDANEFNHLALNLSPNSNTQSGLFRNGTRE